MNQLNSVIYEAVVTKVPVLSKTPRGMYEAYFTIRAERYYKNEDGRQLQISVFDVRAEKRLAQVCAEYLTEDRGVRIVGRLTQVHPEGEEPSSRSYTYIEAEHIEFSTVQGKPMKKVSA